MPDAGVYTLLLLSRPMADLMHLNILEAHHRVLSRSALDTAAGLWLPLLFLPCKSLFMASANNKPTGIYSIHLGLLFLQSQSRVELKCQDPQTTATSPAGSFSDSSDEM